LPQNFEVVLDTGLLLDEAVSRLINKAGSDTKLTQILIDFALEKIDDNKSWDIALDLNKIGKLLFDENNKPHLEKLADKDVDSFLELQKSIQKKIKESERSAQILSKQVLSLIEDSGLAPADFPRETLPNHFKKIIDNTFEPAKLYNNKLEENLAAGKILKAGINSPIPELHSQLLSLYLEVKDHIYNRALLINAYKNIVPLTVLNSIQQEVKNIELERDQLSISEFNTIISNEIRDQPAPFIYERLGEKYRHYFIDEFQDTSELQWQNLIPLVDNALSSEKGSLFLVGDAKQAIYRWRGGKAEQFLRLVNGSENPFVFLPKVESLPTNYRSHEEIVKFNNTFFTSTSSYLNNPRYQTLFDEGNKQGGNDKKGGFVQLTFLEENDESTIDEQYGHTVLNIIYEVLEKKHVYKDICILVRGNREGVKLANFLSQEKIPIISVDSLLLKSSPKILFLINLLYYQNQSQDLEIAYRLVSYLSFEKENRHHFIHQHLNNIEELFKELFEFDLSYLKQASVFDVMEYAIKQFNLAPKADAYINFFMDTVFDIEQKEGTGIPQYLSFWEKKKDSLSIAAPATINAVQIMTVHKAKGLEFNITIFPYANSKIYNEIEPKLWLPIEQESFNGFEEVLINKKQEVAHYNELAEGLFNDENDKLELDSFNILYVALTRAVKALYVITKKESAAKTIDKPRSYVDLFQLYLKEQGLYNETMSTYSFGKLAVNDMETMVEEQEQLSYQYSYKERSSFKILAKSGQLWDTDREDALIKGNLLHYIMSLIETSDDIENALAAVLRSGDIVEDEIDGLKSKIIQIINHPKLQLFYSNGNTIKNEKDIITQNGSIIRPDRVVITENRATIIDYKTGKQDSTYKEQVYDYADALEEMGYAIENKIIIYINEVITPEFI
jgi:ATP-dependent exoDNAse (exonuclease V) beta subunit